MIISIPFTFSLTGTVRKTNFKIILNLQNAQDIPTGKTPWAPYGPNIANTTTIDETGTDAKVFLVILVL
jgi:hypothetical protein